MVVHCHCNTMCYKYAMSATSYFRIGLDRAPDWQALQYRQDVSNWVQSVDNVEGNVDMFSKLRTHVDGSMLRMT